MKKFLIPSMALLTAGLLAVDPALAQNNSGSWVNSTSDNFSGAGWGGSLRGGVQTFVNFFLLFLGLVATIMVIYGGFLYITAAGEDQKTEKGKNILIYAAVGILIILISFAVVNTFIGVGQQGSGAASS